MRKVRRLLKENWIPIVVGILLTKWAVDYAYRVRGYDAIGSEWLVLPFTIFIFNWGKAVCQEVTITTAAITDCTPEIIR